MGSPDKQKRLKKEVKINIDEYNFPNESERVAPLPPAKVSIPSSSSIIQISCGLHHTVVLTSAGEVFTFGSNQHGQLGTGDLQPASTPIQVKIPCLASQVAAGSNHTVVLSQKGIVYTFGNYQKGQLGRLPSDPSSTPSNLNEFQTVENASAIIAQRQRFLWNCIPSPIAGIGPNHRRKACWISASGDQTFIKIDESLVNANSLTKINVAADKNTIIFISNNESSPGCITINKQDGKCKTHTNNQYVFNNYFYEGSCDDAASDVSNSSSIKEFPPSTSSSPSTSMTAISNTIFTMDPLYDVLWCFDVLSKKVLCFNILASKVNGNASAIFKSDMTLPNKNILSVTRVHACLNVLACLDTLAYAQNSLDTCFDTKAKISKTLSTENPILKDSKETK